jgi:hypothetical protein
MKKLNIYIYVWCKYKLEKFIINLNVKISNKVIKRLYSIRLYLQFGNKLIISKLF